MFARGRALYSPKGGKAVVQSVLLAVSCEIMGEGVGLKRKGIKFWEFFFG